MKQFGVSRCIGKRRDKATKGTLADWGDSTMPNMSLQKVKMPEQDPKERNSNFSEVALGYTPEMAVEEAQRCLQCKHRPCVAGCPVSVQIPEFIKLVSEGKFEEA